MLKKLHTYFLLGLGLTTVFLITMLNTTETKNSKKHQEISSRAEYEEFLAQHPFNNRRINLEEWENTPKADRPDLAWEQDYLATMNPATGKPEREKLTPILEMTKDMMQNPLARVPGGSGVGEAWVERGPNNIGGRTRALAWDPTTANKVWAGGVTGGLWYNNDITSSGTWTKVDDFWDAIAVSAIAFDPNDANTIYVGTGEGFGVGSSRGAGIWKSTDGGNTWAQLSPTTSYYYILDLVVNNEGGTSVVYAAVSASYYMGSWHGIASEGLQRSTNGGTSWTQVMPLVSSRNVLPADLEIGADGEIWVGTKNNSYGNGGGRVYSSTNGTSWTLNHTHSSSGRVELACAPNDADYVYAIFEANSQVNAIKRTTNDGSTWTSLSEPNDDDTGISASDFSRGQAWYDLIIQVDPNDKDVAIAGGIDLFRTADGGSTWNQLSHWYGGFGHPYVHADQHQVMFKPGSSTTAIFGNDGGVAYSSDLTSANPTFEAKNNGYNVTQFYACAIHPDSGSNRFMAGSQDNGTQVYSSTGMNSTVDPIGGDGAYCHFLQTDGKYAIGSYVYNNYYHSTNSASSFSNIGSDNTGSFINPSDFHDALAIQYSVKNNTTLKKIININDSPSASDVTLPYSTDATVTHIRSSEYTATSSTLFLGTSSGKIFKVENADTTPTMIDITGGSFPNGSISCIDLGSNENELIVTFSNYGVNSVWYSTDGGTSWASREGDLPDMPVRWALMNPNNNQEVILATEVGVWATTNFQSASPNWTASNSGLANVRVDMLKHRTSDDVVIAATHGRGLFSSTFSPASCPLPTSLTATSVTPTSASLGWTEAGSATAWDIEWGASGFTPTGTPTITGTTTNLHSLTGLTTNTAYDFYVRANCGGGDLSTWAGPYTFTTPCATVSTFPFTETFEDASPSRACWRQVQETGSGDWTYNSGASGGSINSAHGGIQNARFVSASPSGGGTPVTKLISPLLDLSSLTSPQVTFYYGQESWFGDQNETKVYYSADGGTTWTEIAHYTSSVSAWTEQTLTLPSPSSTYKIAFEGINNYGHANVIDDVVVEETPSCPNPTTLTATSLTSTSANLGWTEVGTATAWDIEWGASGFTPTGTPTITGTTTNPNPLTGLTANTAYDFYVRANCGSGDLSTWAGPYSFTTSCVALTAPITETFSSSSTPTCWSQSAASGGPWVFGTPGFLWNTTVCAGVPNDHTSGGGTNYAAVDFSTPDAAVVLEMVDVDVSSLTTPYLSFYYYMCNTYANSLFVESWDGVAWNSVVTNTTGTSGWEEIGISLVGHTYGSSLVRLRFRAEPSASTIYYGDAAIDDVSIIEMPSQWTGATDTDWATATNWITGSVPTSSDDVVIPNVMNKPIISANTGAVANNLTIDGASTLTINGGGSLIVSGTSTGNITYKRNLAAQDKWYLVSSPFSGETIDNLIATHTFATGTAPNIGLAPYDNEQLTNVTVWDYQTTSSTGNIHNGQGYSVRLASPGYISFTGTLNTADVTKGITIGAGNAFNLIGNPYPSFINSGTFLSTNTSKLSKQTIWVWNQATDSYDTKVTVQNFILAPGQGFFVKCGTPGDVTFAETNQSHEETDTFQRQTTPEIKVLVADESTSRYAQIYYFENATTGFDNGYDGELFGGAENSFELYSHLLTDNENKKYQIQSLPNSGYESMVIPVGIRADADKEITFSVEAINLPTGIKVFLEDKEPNTFIRLDEANTAYTVTLSEALDGIGRFYLHTSTSALSIDDNLVLNSVSIYKLDATTLRIVNLPQGNTHVKLFNTIGKQMLHTSFEANGTKEISLSKLAAGIYIVQVQTEKGTKSRKIFLE